LAKVAKHLTPKLFAGEVRKVRPGVPIYAIHLKARFFKQIIRELDALKLPGVCVLEPGQVIDV
jgi:hypothetical protein